MILSSHAALVLAMARAGSPAKKYPYRLNADELKKLRQLKYFAQFGGLKEKQDFSEYKKKLKARRMEPGKEEYYIDGQRMSRFQLMDYIVKRVQAGESLPKVCAPYEKIDEDHERITGMPDIGIIYKWKKMHPDFAKALKEAEEVRGHILGEEALEIAMTAKESESRSAKLKVETLLKFAARTNPLFQDKTVVETRDEYSQMTKEQLVQRAKAMLAADPELAAIMGSEPTLPTLSEKEPSSGVIELDEEGTGDLDHV